MELQLEQKKKDEDDRGWWGVGSAGLPVSLNAGYEVIDSYEEAVVGYQADVESEQHKELLVPLSHTVIHPGTVMVHLLDTPSSKTRLISKRRQRKSVHL